MGYSELVTPEGHWPRLANKRFSRYQVNLRRSLVADTGDIDRYQAARRVNHINYCAARGVRIPRSLRRFL